MYKKNVIFFEGNPKVGFGGGQRVSLQVAQVLSQENYRLFFVNLGEMNDFSCKMSSFSQETLELKRHGFVFKLFALLLFIKRNNLNKDNAFIYSTVKPGDIFSLVLKLFFKFFVISHVHMMKEALGLVSQVLMTFVYQFMDQTIVVSKSVEDSWNFDNASLLLNSIQKSSYKKIEARREVKRLAIVGHIIKTKGVERFLNDYYASIVSMGLELHIWGDGEDLALLKAKYPDVIWEGFSKNLSFDLSKCDLLIFPSTVSESFGLVIIEAAQLGIPCISTNLGGQAEVSESLYGNEYLYSVENQKSFWDCFYNIQKNYKKLSRDGYKKAKELYSEEAFYNNLKKIINSSTSL